MDAEAVLIPIIAIVGFFASFIVLVYMFFSSRNRIRMALIEQGKDASIFRTTTSKTVSLRNGIVALMTGVGLIFGYLLDRALGMPEFIAYLSMVLIFGGLGLISYYLYVRSRYPAEEIV